MATVKTKGKLLDRFVKFFVAVASQYTGENVPTFTLILEEDFFRLENYQSLYSCLRQCGQGLLDLHITVPKYGGSLPGAFPNLALPTLNQMKVVFTEHLAVNLEQQDTIYFGHDANVVLLLQSLLNKAESLSRLEICCEDGVTNCTPLGIQFISLPESLQQLELACQMRANQLDLLITNELPKLSMLILTAEDYIESNVLYKILQKFCKTLSLLAFFAKGYLPPRQICKVNFPVMENLLVLSIQNPDIVLEEKRGVALETCLPKLKRLHLGCQFASSVQKWVSNGPIPSVVELTLQQMTEPNRETDEVSTLAPELDLLQSVHQTFCNVRDLTVFTSGTELGSLGFIFQKMPKLTKLAFTWDGTGNSKSIGNSDLWDALLIGVPQEFVKSLKNFLSLWNKLDFKDKESPSIRLLSDLKSLQLRSTSTNDSDEDDSTSSSSDSEDDDNQKDDAVTPLISDLTFIFALLKMPKLLELELGGRFSVSNAMIGEWTNKGGCIRYIN